MWMRILQETYGYNSVFFVGVDQSKWKAVLPLVEIDSRLTGKRGVCIPFSDLGCVLHNGDQQSVRDLLAEAKTYGKKHGWKYLELRGGYEDGSGVGASEYLYHTLALGTDEQQVFSGFSDNVKRNIRKCERCGVQIGRTTSEQALRSFYQLHTKNRKRHGLPVQPYRFFQSIRRNLFETDHGYLVEAVHEGRVISSHLYCFYGDKIFYKYGASEQRSLSVRPNNGIIWDTIRWALANGYKELSFGRTDMEDTGLARFKASWGAESKVIRYWRCGLCAAVLQNDCSGRCIPLLAHMPNFVSRAIGELLYRHFG